jgi:hypothetical protein
MPFCDGPIDIKVLSQTPRRGTIVTVLSDCDLRRLGIGAALANITKQGCDGQALT